jgi:hypothetical protein
MFSAEVWTGDQWMTLGIYSRRGMAQRRVDRSRSNQEHRVRPVSDQEADRVRANLRLRGSSDRRNIAAKY